VGIGTTDTAGCLLRLNSATAARETGIYVRAFQASLTLDTITGRRWNIWSTEASNAVGSGCLAMYDNTAAAYRLVINPSGRVGINMTNPTAPLTVTGSITIRDSPGNNIFEPGCIYTDVNWGMLFRGAVNANIAHMRWDRSDGTTLMKIQNTGVLSFNGGGTNYAVENGQTTRAGALCIGNINTNYGGGWQAGLMMECADTTEISCHDSGLRLTSFIFYDGGNRLYIGRDIGYGSTPVTIPSSLSANGEVYCNNWFRNVGNGGLWNETYGRGIRCSDAEGNSYGNISTHGTGRNGWSGYGLGTRYAFMSNGSDIGSTWGIHDNTYSWLIRGSGFFNREVILGGGSTMCSRNFDRFVVWLSAAEYDYGGGYFFVNASGGFGITSDSRLKENIHPIKGSESITFLKHLQPSSFCMKEAKPFERENADGTKEIVQPDSCSCKQDGFIADNVYEAVVASGASKSVLSHWSGWLEEMKKPEEERELGKDNILGVCDRPILSHTVNVVKVLMEQVNILEQRNIILEQSARHQEKVFNEYKALTDSKIEKLANLLSQLIK